MWGVLVLSLRDAVELIGLQLLLAVVTWLASLVGLDLPPPARTARVHVEA